MKAGQIVAPRQIEIIDIEKPDLADYPDGTVMIKTLHSAICGTDMPSFALEHPADSYPRLGRGFPFTRQLALSPTANRTASRQVTRFSRFRGISEVFQNTFYPMRV